MIHLKMMTKFSDTKYYNVTCICCGKLFRSKTPNKRLCSDKCLEEQRKKKMAEHDEKRSCFTASCIICGKMFRGKEPRQGIKKRRTCSPKCQHSLSLDTDPGLIFGLKITTLKE